MKSTDHDWISQFQHLSDKSTQLFYYFGHNKSCDIKEKKEGREGGRGKVWSRRVGGGGNGMWGTKKNKKSKKKVCSS